MKTTNWKLGKALSWITIVYLLCSIFGCVLYLVLPPFLSSVGSRVHVYWLISAAMEDGEDLWSVILAIVFHLYVLIQIIFGFFALKTGHIRNYTLLTALEILLTLGFLMYRESLTNEFTTGILLNIVYCLWLFRVCLSQKTAAIK